MTLNICRSAAGYGCMSFGKGGAHMNWELGISMQITVSNIKTCNSILILKYTSVRLEAVRITIDVQLSRIGSTCSDLVLAAFTKISSHETTQFQRI